MQIIRIILIVLAVIVFAIFGTYTYHIKNIQQKNIYENDDKNVSVQGNGVTFSDLNGFFLAHKISLEQLQINNTGTEEGNGALLFQQLLKINTSDPNQIKDATEILNQLAKKKDFSIYPELFSYPKTLDEFINAQFFTGTSEVVNVIINYARNLPDADPQKEMIFQNMLVMGRQLISEKDFSTTIGILVGISIENKATQNLIELYTRKQKDALVNIYESYQNENKAFKDRMSFFY